MSRRLLATTCLLTSLWKSFTVEVSGSSDNLALNKSVYQSSTYHHYNGYDSTAASLAVDGNFGSDFSTDGCAHTISNTGEWWLVDLNETYTVHRVSLTNRGDCCGDRLADFYIRVGNTFNESSFDPTTYTLCHYQQTALSAGETRMFVCNEPIKGRFVTVHFPTTKSERLTLCEVAVYGPITAKTPEYRKGQYHLYQGPEKNYRILWQATRQSKAGCMEQCTLEPECDAVKVAKVTGTRSSQCLLLQNGDGDAQMTKVYERI